MRLGRCALSLLLLGLAGCATDECAEREAPAAASGDVTRSRKAATSAVSDRSRERAVDWSAPIRVASGRGRKGPWRMNDSSFHYVDDGTVAFDGTEGGVVVAWVNQTRQNVLLQRYRADGTARFEHATDVSRSRSVFSWLPTVVVDPGPEGSEEPPTVHVLWQEIIFSGGTHGGEAFYARSTDGGLSFSEPTNLSNTIAGAGKGRLNPDYWHNGSLDLAMGPDGTLHAVWTVYEGGLFHTRSTDDGRSFAEPTRIAGGEGEGELPARGPSLAAADDGDVWLAWTVGRDPEADVHLARSDDRGRSFGAPRVPFERPGHADAPDLVVDDAGRIHLVYAESPDGPLQLYHVRYARTSAEGDAGFGAPRRISQAPGPAFEGAGFPDLERGREGALYVLWELFPGRDVRPMGLGFTRSTDGGEAFAPATVVPGTADPALGHNGSLQGLLMDKLAVDGDGRIAVVESRFAAEEGSAVRLIRGRATSD